MSVQKSMQKYRTPITPLPEPMTANVPGTFAHSAVTKRFPKILRQTLSDNDFPPQVSRDLEQLMEEIPDANLVEFDDPSAPDNGDWHQYLPPYLEKNWLQVPWFIAEMYFYRRIIAAIDFYQPGPMRGYDPFLKEKQQGLESATQSINNLGDFLAAAVQPARADSEHKQSDFHQLLVLNVWGNQADLSMWSASEDRPDHQDMADQRTHLLVDDADRVFDHLEAMSNQPTRVDFILDNFGPELVHDIGLADYLLSTGLAEKVRFHAKPNPTYVSDAMIKDIHSTITYLAGSPRKSVSEMSNRIQDYLTQERLELETNFFWTSPLYFWEMPDDIRQEISGSDLVISKGDANYRRLSGDLDWPPTTSFHDVVRYFPTPLLALRVLKAELALGLTTSQVRELDNQDPDWKFNGNWAVIQFHKS
ncbi:MAG: damage-control phosphatase ARMT1 family protein [Anaerolineales bacterium]